MRSLVLMVAAATVVLTAAEQEEDPQLFPREPQMPSSPIRHHLHPHVLEKRVLEKQVLEDELTYLEEEPRHPLDKERHRLKKVTKDTHPIKHKSRVDFPGQSEHPAPEADSMEEDAFETINFSGEEPPAGEEDFLHSMEQVSHHNVPEESRHHHVTESTFDETTMPSGWMESSEDDVEPTAGTERSPGMEVMQEPVVLPVTEGKNRGQEPVVHYGLPKELMPIHPGGGSKFEDLEREKLERAKMAQTKADDDGDTENGTSHDAEGLYSSAASLCISSLIFSFSYLRILI
ncbi:uncharacterized protein [Procambarus clarkii]|uniref:uncharacterized protein n=1 Tax=Procambarus clarkii TaxID=6728 RepID=UPI00374446F2